MRATAACVCALTITGCTVAPSRYETPEWRTGWGTSAPTAGGVASVETGTASYPARFPRFDDATLRDREEALARERSGWTVRLATSGFVARAEHAVAAEDRELSGDEVASAQRFIDAHYAVFGLARPTPLRRWDDGLWFIAAIDDPRFGIAVIHSGWRLVVTGHLWPGVALRSNARRSLSALLAPWLGARVTTSDVTPEHPCDPVRSADDCPRLEGQTVVVVGPDVARYVVYASPTASGDAVEVRDLCVLALPPRPKLVGAAPSSPPPLPAALDARTGEPLDLEGAVDPGACEQEGACVGWSWARSERNVLFWHWVSYEGLHFDERLTPPSLRVAPAPP